MVWYIITLQSELSKARLSAKQSEAALREKNVDVEKLSTLKQQEGGSLRTALQAKEMELTKAMDKLLQVSHKFTESVIMIAINDIVSVSAVLLLHV